MEAPFKLWQYSSVIHLVLLLPPQGVGGSRLSAGQQAGPVSRPAGVRGRGPAPGPGEPLPLPGGVGGRGLPGHRQPLHDAHPPGDGTAQAPDRQEALQRLQVHGQAHQQRVRQEEEVGVTDRESAGDEGKKEGNWTVRVGVHLVPWWQSSV